MSATKPLCFYYPTTIVIIDDNKTFLESLPDNLNKSANYKLFDSPIEALAFFESQRQHLPTPEAFLGVTDDLVTGISLNVDIPKIRTRLQDKHRFKTPAVIIVDHDMPEMSGLEFCQKLNDYPIKKIMLTGAADHKLAVKAFNDGIIQRFIAKDDPNVFEVIDQAVFALQQDYFSELSAQIAKNITTTTFSFLSNKAFQDFFSDFIKKNHITEFYLIDPIGSFLLINDKGEQVRLVVQSEQEIENYCQIAEDHNASEAILQALTNKEKLLCLFSEDDFNQPIEKWGAYLHKANKAHGINGCYYTVIDHKDKK